MAIGISTRVAMMTGYSLVFLFGFAGNICVILVILTSKRFRKSISSILITNIAIADFFVCLVSAPYFLSGLLIAQPEKQGSQSLDSVCKGFVVFAYSLGFTRIMLLAIISIERFIAINHPFFYQRHCSSSLPNIRVTVICCYPWFHAFLTTSPASYMKGWVRYEGKVGKLCGYAWEDANLGFVVPLIVVNFCLPLAVIVYTNFKVYLTARRQRRRIAACFGVASPTRVSHRNFVKENFTARRKVQRKIGRQENPSFTLYDENNNDIETCRSPRVRDSNTRRNTTNGLGFLTLAESGRRSSGHLINMTETNLDAETSCYDSSIQPPATPSKFSKSVDVVSSTASETTNQEKRQDLQLSVSTKFDDSGFKDESLGRFSYLSSGATFKSAKESKRSSSFLTSDSFLAVRRSLGRFAQGYRRKNTAEVMHRNNRGKTKDFVVFFSTLSVVTLFLCTWLPFVIVSIVILFSHSVVSEEADLIVSMITVIDSAFTPIIVLGTRREFRKQLLQKLCRLSND